MSISSLPTIIWIGCCKRFILLKLINTKYPIRKWAMNSSTLVKSYTNFGLLWRYWITHQYTNFLSYRHHMTREIFPTIWRPWTSTSMVLFAWDMHCWKLGKLCTWINISSVFAVINLDDTRCYPVVLADYCLNYVLFFNREYRTSYTHLIMYPVL